MFTKIKNMFKFVSTSVITLFVGYLVTYQGDAIGLMYADQFGSRTSYYMKFAKAAIAFGGPSFTDFMINVGYAALIIFPLFYLPSIIRVVRHHMSMIWEKVSRKNVSSNPESSNGLKKTVEDLKKQVQVLKNPAGLKAELVAKKEKIKAEKKEKKRLRSILFRKFNAGNLKPEVA